MTEAKLHDISMLGIYATRIVNGTKTINSMKATIEARAENQRRKGITNPMPGIMTEIAEFEQRLKTDLDYMNMALTSLGLENITLD